jgi:hypothetical protein
LERTTDIGITAFAAMMAAMLLSPMVYLLRVVYIWALGF